MVNGKSRLGCKILVQNYEITFIADLDTKSYIAEVFTMSGLGIEYQQDQARVFSFSMEGTDLLELTSLVISNCLLRLESKDIRNPQILYYSLRSKKNGTKPPEWELTE
jgi:hypothetical protein